MIKINIWRSMGQFQRKSKHSRQKRYPGFDDNDKTRNVTHPVLMIPAKVYPSHNRGKPSVLMIPTKIYPSRNRSFAAGFDDTDKDLSQPQPQLRSRF